MASQYHRLYEEEQDSVTKENERSDHHLSAEVSACGLPHRTSSNPITTQSVPAPPYTAFPASQLWPVGDGYRPVVGVPYVDSSGVPVMMIQPRGQAGMLPVRKPPPTFLPLSIFACLCCLWPVGLAAIVYSQATDAAIQSGDYIKAKSKSKMALILSLVSIVGGIILIVVVTVIRVQQMNAEFNERYN